MKRRALLQSSLVGAVAVTTGIRATAAGRTTRVIVPFAAGGATDLLARALAEHLGRLSGEVFIIDNRPGASGKIGTNAALGAKPDGQTLVLNVASNYTLVPQTQRDPNERVLTPFLPVSALSLLDFAIYVRPELPAKNVSELRKLVQQDPSAGFYSTSGRGNITNFFGLMFARATGLAMQDVPFQGGAPALLAVMGGQVPSGFGAVSASLIQSHQTNKVRVLAVMGSKRNPFLSDVPTMAESGVPEIALSDWVGIFAPPGTPTQAISNINSLVAEVHKNPDFIAALNQTKLEPLIAGPAECSARLRKEYDIWQPIAKSSGIVVG